MTDSTPISPDLPELRLLAQSAGLKPSSLAAALNNPEHFSKHISAEELTRYLAGADRLIRLVARISDILLTEANRSKNQRTKVDA